MKIILLGNYRFNWTLESQIANTLEDLSHKVFRVQEARNIWVNHLSWPRCDMFLWIRNSLLDPANRHHERGLQHFKTHKIPTVGIHLDKYFDLDREHLLTTDPFFTSLDYLFTADGGNDDRFRSLNINHYWFQPAIYKPDCFIGKFDPQYESDIAFVGNWHSYPHKKWTHRSELITFLTETYGPRFHPFPPVGEQIRSPQLNNLYASCKVVVGDSCMVGGNGYYFSDRLPITLGMGAYFLHPWSAGIARYFQPWNHFDMWRMGNWSELEKLINHALEDEPYRKKVGQAGHELVRTFHTYHNRMAEVIETVFPRPATISSQIEEKE